MYNNFLLILLIGHVLGDFYTQTSKIAEQKKKDFYWVLLHSLLYFATITAVSVPFASVEIFLLDLVASIVHLIIDVIKYSCLRKKKKDVPGVFVADQTLHLLSLIGLSYIWTKNNNVVQELQVIADFCDVTGISEVLLGKWLLALLIVHKPANILIQNLIKRYKPKLKENEIKVDNNVGRLIGSVERIIMLLLMYRNQYSAIGLVLTAKSIARYDRIARDEEFAEYYLLGTLISTGIVILCAVMLF